MPQNQSSTKSANAAKAKVPKSEILWVTYSSANGEPRYLITSKPMRDMYFLYQVQSDGSLKKLGKSASPGELEQEYEIREKL